MKTSNKNNKTKIINLIIEKWNNLSKQNKIALILISLFAILSVFVSSKYFFGNIMYQFENEKGAYLFQDLINQDHYIYSDKIGWIMLGSGTTQHQIIQNSLRFVETKDGAYFKGYAYADTIGYILFGKTNDNNFENGRFYKKPSEQSKDEYGVNALKVTKNLDFKDNTVTGTSLYQLEGYAWSENAGFIYFGEGTENYTGVYITTDGRLIGYAYSPVFGEIYFGDTDKSKSPKLAQMTESNLIAINTPTSGNVRVTASGNSLYVTWDPIIDPNTGLPFENINYLLWKNTGSTINKNNAINIYSGNVLSYLDNNVLPGISYSYYVTYMLNNKEIYVANIGTSKIIPPKDDNISGNQDYIQSPVLNGICKDNISNNNNYCDTISLYITGITADTIGFNLYTAISNALPAAKIYISNNTTHFGSININNNVFRYLFSESDDVNYKYMISITNDDIPYGNYDFYITAILNKNGKEIETPLIDPYNRISIYNIDPNQEGFVLTFNRPMPNNTYMIGDDLTFKFIGNKNKVSINQLPSIKYGPETNTAPNHIIFFNNFSGSILDEIKDNFHIIYNTKNYLSISEDIIKKIKNIEQNQLNHSNEILDKLGFVPYKEDLSNLNNLIVDNSSAMKHPDLYYMSNGSGSNAYTGYYVNIGLYPIYLSGYNSKLSNGNYAFELRWNKVPGIEGGIGIYDILVNKDGNYVSIKDTNLKFTDINGNDIILGDSNTGGYISGLENDITYKFKVIAKIYTENNAKFESISNVVEVKKESTKDIKLVIVREGFNGESPSPWNNDILDNNNQYLINLTGNKYVLNNLSFNNDENSIIISNNADLKKDTTTNGVYILSLIPNNTYDITVKANGYNTFKATYKENNLILGSGAGVIYSNENDTYIIGIPLKGDIASATDIEKYNNNQCSETNNCIGNPDGKITKEEDAMWLWYATNKRAGTMEYLRSDGKVKIKYLNENSNDIASATDIEKYNNNQCSETNNCIGTPDGKITKEEDAMWLWYATNKRAGTMEYLRSDGKVKIK